MITIKEEAVFGPKLRKAIRTGGHEVVSLWLALKAYAAANPTDGFVPEDAIEDACQQLGVRNLRRAMEALMGCGQLRRDGSKGSGLVDPHEFGCQLHDYADHAMSSEELVERQLKDRERKQLQRARSALRTQLMQAGSSSNEAERAVREMTSREVLEALNSDRVTRDTAEVTDDVTPHVTRDSHDVTDDVTRDIAPMSRAGAPASGRPNPAQPNPVTVVVAERERDISGIPCPPDLNVTRDEFAQLELGTGMSREFVDRLVPLLRAKFMSDTPRTAAKWQRTLIAALTTTWSDPNRRAEVLGKQPSRPVRSQRQPVQPSHGVDPFALVLAETQTA